MLSSTQIATNVSGPFHDLCRGSAGQGGVAIDRAIFDLALTEETGPRLRPRWREAETVQVIAGRLGDRVASRAFVAGAVASETVGAVLVARATVDAGDLGTGSSAERDLVDHARGATQGELRDRPAASTGFDQTASRRGRPLEAR
jgi:hypothetical protein